MKRVKSTGLSGRSRKIKNAAGAAAYSLPAKERLVTGVLTCFFNEPKHYGDTSNDLVSTARELAKTDPEFVAKLAVYARKEFHMRTISQVLAAEAAKAARGNPIVRRMTRKVIERPDDMTNILAYWFDTFGPRKTKDGKRNPVTRSLRRGIADAFHQFDEYQLAKYKGEGGLVKLRDALLIARPKPKNKEQGALWKRLIESKLKVPETREAVLSEKGQSKEVWEDFIDSGKLGFMAMLRNLGNFIKNKVSKTHIGKVIARLTNQKAVEKGKQLPFRFFTAYKMLQRDHRGSQHYGPLREALAKALELSVVNMPKLEGTTAMTADESGSMTATLSGKGVVTYMDVGNLMMAISDGFCDKSVVTVFGDTTKKVTFAKDDTILDKMDKIRRVGGQVGMSTRLCTAIDYLTDHGIKVDRIIVFSDMQSYSESLGWGGRNAETEVEESLNRYRREVSPEVWVHSIDLTGYGTIKTKGGKVNLISGWSEKVFDFIKMAEEAGTSLTETIENYEV